MIQLPSWSGFSTKPTSTTGPCGVCGADDVGLDHELAAATLEVPQIDGAATQVHAVAVDGVDAGLVDEDLTAVDLHGEAAQGGRLTGQCGRHDDVGQGARRWSRRRRGATPSSTRADHSSAGSSDAGSLSDAVAASGWSGHVTWQG